MEKRRGGHLGTISHVARNDLQLVGTGNPDSAEQIGKYGSIVDKQGFHALAETLYKDSGGEYYLHCQGGAATKYAKQANEGTTYGEKIQLFTREEALNWCEERTIDPDNIIEEFADLIENINET